MINNSYYSQDRARPLRAARHRQPRAGRRRAPSATATLAYATFGTLNAAKDNAILVPDLVLRAPTRSSSRCISARDARWIRTSTSSSSSIRLATAFRPRRTTRRHRPAWPISRTCASAMTCARSIKLVTEKFGLNSLALVVGGSMGAQQTYEWAVRYPDMVKRAAPIAGTARNTVHDFLFTETLVEAITSDPGFNKGFYALAGGRPGRPAAPRQDVGGDGMEHGVFPAGQPAQGAGLFVHGRFHHQLHERAISA